MDNHFRQMLSLEQDHSGAPFIESSSFVGPKAGYVFKRGDRGLGYYLDVDQSLLSEEVRRKLES